MGAQAAKEMMAAAYKKWPDLHLTIEAILAEGDKVMVRNTWHMTDSQADDLRRLVPQPFKSALMELDGSG